MTTTTQTRYTARHFATSSVRADACDHGSSCAACGGKIWEGELVEHGVELGFGYQPQDVLFCDRACATGQRFIDALSSTDCTDVRRISDLEATLQILGCEVI